MKNRNITRAMALVLAFVLLIPGAAFAKAQTSFTDVETGSWYEDGVSYASEKGFMQGTGSDRFDPAKNLTRAELTQVLYRKAGSPAQSGASPYTDVEDGAWCSAAARWAAAEKIAAKTEGAFGPNEAITREETAYMLWNYAKSLGMDVSIGEDTNILSYDDAFDVTQEYIPAIQWTCGSCIMNGTGEGKLEPQALLTRAQFAVMLRRLGMQPRTGSDLSLWTIDADAAQEFLDYIAAVTDESSSDFISVKDRIAVFDLDGTLFCETDPNYFDYTLLAYRVLDDPEYKDKSSDFER